MQSMFNRSRVNNLDISSFDTSNVTNMGSMFARTEMNNLDVSNFDTSNVTQMDIMFFDTKIKNLDVSFFNTSKVTNMRYMFSQSRLIDLDLSNFDTSNVVNMEHMFSNSPMEVINLLNFNTNRVTNMSNIFQNSRQLRQLVLGDSFWFGANANLPNVPNNNEFLGVWQSVGKGTVSNPLGAFQFTSSELMTNYNGENMSDIYVWKPNLPGGRVVVHYEDRTGVALSEVVIIDAGQIGMPYTTYAKDISGYTLIETPQNATGIFTAEEQDVRYIYNRSDAAPVTVKYKDSEGNQLAEPTILSGKVGLPYDSDPKEIPGWYVAETPANASGTFTEEAQEVVYVYERSDAAPVTVKYQDSEGDQLAEPTILSGKVGLPYDSDPKEIPGWYVVEIPSNASGTFTEEAQEVVYVYERSDAAPVTVKYKDSAGTQLAEPTILSGKVGLPYDSDPKEIPGWYVVETPSNASGVFSEDPQEVVYVYNRSDAAPVTVKHKDTEGNQLAEPVILSGKVGLPYASEAKEIPGWYVAETPDNASGVFSEDPQEVVYVYNTKSLSPKDDKHSDNYLPKTGGQIIGQIIMTTLGTLLCTLVLVAFKKRKKSN